VIYETVITTMDAHSAVHIAPMGIRIENGKYLISPFKPSKTRDNLLSSGAAVINMTDDVLIFSGCLTGREDWPTVKAEVIACDRLENSLAHIEVEVQSHSDDELRSVFFCEKVHEDSHAPFSGFNRAQAAVIEAAVLVSRLHILPEEKIRTELGYLQIAIDKTAGEKERSAWKWLIDKVERYYNNEAIRP